VWHRQSPARAVGLIIRVLSLTTATTGITAGILLLITENLGISATVAGYAILVVCAVTLVIFTWRNDIWKMERGLRRQGGMVIKREYSMPKEKLTALEVERSVFFAIFRAVRIAVCTSADDKNSRPLLVRREVARKLAARLMPMEKGYVREYQATNRQVFLLAMAQADFFTGVMLALPAIVWLAENIDRRLSERLYTELEITGRFLLPEVSPWLSALALVPLAGWCFHLIYTFFRYGKFKYARSGGTIIVGHGILSRKTITFPVSAVSALECRSTLLSGMAMKESIRAIITGYGECVMMPAAGRREMMLETSALFPHGVNGGCVRCKEETYWWRWWCAGVVTVIVVTARMTMTAGEYRAILLLCAVPVILMLLWKTAMAFRVSRHACVRLFADSIEITGLRGLTMCSLRVLRGSISEAKITQNIFQQSSGLCDMYIRAQGSRRGVRCRHLPYDECIAIIGRMG